MKRTVGYLGIGQVNVLQVDLPIYTLKGKEDGKIGVITANLHGNETVGTAALVELAKKLRLKAGKLVIIPCANPFGQIQQTRIEPIDGSDLNRIAPGKASGNLSQRIVKAICDQVQQADFFIDVHSYRRRAVTTGLLITKTSVEEIQKEMLRRFSPKLVIDLEPNINAIDVWCSRDQNIPAIAVEIPRMEFISPGGFDRVVDGLSNVAAFFELCQPTGQDRKPIPRYCERSKLLADIAGVFQPLSDVLQEVRIGQQLGVITSLSELKEVSVKAPADGTILTIQSRSIVQTGTKLLTIGEQIGTL